MKGFIAVVFMFAYASAEFNITSPNETFDYESGVRKCRQNYIERLNECLIEVINLIQPRMGAGIPELNIPRLEPLLLKNIVFKQSEPPVTVEAVYSNVQVSGITAFDIKYLDINMREQVALVGLTIPSLTMRGQYRIGGNVFLLPVEGEGDFITILDGMIVEGVGNLEQRDNVMTLADIHIEFKIRSMQTKMDNLFQGNTILSDTIHHFLNENGHLVLEEIRPGISLQLNDFLKKLMNSMLSVMPADIFQTIPNANTKDKHRLRTLSIKAAEAAAAGGSA
ncbi:hemolymph juvenile hormone binding [Trinorchestia longiramus]|nr:hemolymph juvenile hormone binding [Trinorchestia longiramus]